MKKSRAKNKPILTAAICLIIIAFVDIIFGPLRSFFPLVASIISAIAVIALGYFIMIGFLELGKKYKNKFFRTIVIIGFVIGVLFSVGGIFMEIEAQNVGIALNEMSLSSDFNNTLTQFETNTTLSPDQRETLGMEIFEGILPIVLPLLIYIGIIFSVYAVLLIVTGAAWITLGKKIKHAKLTGIFMIVGAVTSVILIGIVFLLVAYIMAIIILFKEAKKAKEY